MFTSLKIMLPRKGMSLVIFITSQFFLTTIAGFEEGHHRQKRFLYFDTGTPMGVGLNFQIPLNFALPTFSLQSARRFRREDHPDNYPYDNMAPQDILPEDSYDDPAYTQELNKLSLYFNALEVDQDVCQRRIICEIFSNPSEYTPLTDLFGSRLTTDHGMVKEDRASRYYRYIRAMEEGIEGGNLKHCHSLYSACPYSSRDRLHVEALKFWTFITSALGLQLNDD